jgi:two-component system, cell cycle sensor histidine kinase and response regulator CckA
MLLIAPEPGVLLPPGVLELQGDRRFRMWPVVLTDRADGPVVQEYLKRGIWDCVSQDALWRLPIVAKRVLETHRLRQQLTEAEELWTGVTHDVSNLLGAVLGHSEFILMRVRQDQEVRRAVEGIMKAAEDAASWMRHGTSAEQPYGERLQITDLNEVVMRMEGLLRLLAGNNIQLGLQMWKEPVHVVADPARVARIVLNLALNAFDAMMAGGQLTLQTEAERVTSARETGSHAAGWGKLTVADSGHGIDTEDQTRIFDRFYSTRGPRRGLGLPTVRALVERFGGHLELKSTAGKGSAFYVYLPYAETMSGKPEVTLPPLARSSGAKNILLVDDDTLLREVLARTLASAGYNVIQAASAHEAIQMHSDPSCSIDLLITDIRLSSMNGHHLADALRERDPKLKIIYISGCPEELSAAEKSQSDLLIKPFRPSALLEKVHTCMGGV